VLCAEVGVDEGVTIEKIRLALTKRDIERAGISASVEPVTPSDVVHGGDCSSLCSPSISARQLDAVFATFARNDSTCERIVHLASYP